MLAAVLSICCSIILVSTIPSARAFAVISSSGGLGSISSQQVGLHLFSSRDADEDDDSSAANSNYYADPEDDNPSGDRTRTRTGAGGLDALIGAGILREARGGADGATTSAAGAARDPPSSSSNSSGDARSSTSDDDASAASSAVQWDVYVDQSRPSRERGSGAALDAFVALAPAELVRVRPAIIARAARGNRRGPIVRCVRRGGGDGAAAAGGGGGGMEQLETMRAIGKGGDDNDAGDGDDSSDQEDDDGGDDNAAILDAFEVGGVDSVDKVYRILTKHMGLGENSSNDNNNDNDNANNNNNNNDNNSNNSNNSNSNSGGLVDATACECLRWSFRGNAHLERDEVAAAIECYGRALAAGCAGQEGGVLLMRSTAYLRRGFQHQAELRGAVEELDVLVPAPEALQSLFAAARQNPALAGALHARVVSDTRRQERQHRRVSYWHSLYEYALLHAAQDALRATQLLPHSSRTWLRAGDALAELRKLREAARYYERAMEIDDALVVSLMPVVERLRSSQQFLDEARELGWPEDTLRLSLDVAG